MSGAKAFGLTRRSLGLSLAAAGVGWGRSDPAHAASALRRAFWAGYPLYEFARTAHAAAGVTAERSSHRFNQIVHRREITTPANRLVTAVNNDVLVSWARIDLSNGPLRLSAPDIGARYWSLILLDAFTDNFFVIGTRASGGKGGAFILNGPQAPRSNRAGNGKSLRCPSADLWLIMRTLFDGPEDRAAVHAIQDRVRLSPADEGAMAPAPRFLPVAPTQAEDPENFLAVVNAMLARTDPRDARRRRAHRFHELGLQTNGKNVWAGLSPRLRAAWAAEIPAALAEMRLGAERLQRVIDGWSYSAEETGRFGANDELRAAVALAGLAALPAEEAMYAHAISDAHGAPLSGAHRYVLDIPAGGPPVDAFWSITMYQVEPDGRLFLTDNPIARYSIGDRTRGLARSADGAIRLFLQHDAPVDPLARANWLPTPAGMFRPAARFYLPRRDMRTLAWRLPAVARVA